ncbi:MAG: DUF4167 domain-containing protein [Hyphomicrobiaceae bacterium]|nr:DUF4167 domain-containing protein [Hyphomicrobiaceae bacterium]
MRQGQQNRRGRGRNNNNNNNNNRKNQNPLTRSFESNGPDVKIRGTPSHIAEKYISLARDAQSSGDPVLAENYMQHAEHYNRIIMAYREQQIQHGGDPGPVMVRRPQISGDFVDGDDFDEDGEESPAENGQPVVSQPFMGANEPQPVVRGFESGRESGRGESGGHEPRQDRRHEGRDHQREGRRGEFHLRPHRERHQGQGNPRGGDGQSSRHDSRSEGRQEFREPRPENRDRDNRPDNRPDNRSDSRNDNRPDVRQDQRPEGRGEGRGEGRSEGRGEPGMRREHQPRPRRDQFGGEQPEFLRRPVRRPRREGPVEEAVAAPAGEPATAGDDGAE